MNNIIYIFVPYDVWIRKCPQKYACILSRAAFYIYQPAYALSQAWLNDTKMIANIGMLKWYS